MQPHQALRAALQYLSTTTLACVAGDASTATIIGQARSSATNAEVAIMFTKSFDCVILDPSCSVNLASRVSLGACHELRAVCSRALAGLGSPPEQLRALLVDPLAPSLLYDYTTVVCIPSAPAWGVASPSPSSLQDQNTATVLSKALGDRVSAIRVLSSVGDSGCAGWGLPEHLCWSLDASPPALSHILVGLTVHSENWSRKIDRGPPANLRDAAHAFRAFWGEVAELRRFPDGAIVEAVGTRCVDTEF